MVAVPRVAAIGVLPELTTVVGPAGHVVLAVSGSLGLGHWAMVAISNWDCPETSVFVAVLRIDLAAGLLDAASPVAAAVDETPPVP